MNVSREPSASPRTLSQPSVVGSHTREGYLFRPSFLLFPAAPAGWIILGINIAPGQVFASTQFQAAATIAATTSAL